VLALVSVGVAAADTPVPEHPNSTWPACIALVGSNGAAAAAAGTFDVVVRDLANNPVAGADVRVDLSNVPDLRLCAQQLASGVTVQCPDHTAAAITDASGRARFTLLGGGSAMATGAGWNAGLIYADGILLGYTTVLAYDLDGSAGVGANDLSLWLEDFVQAQYVARSDYDCSGGLGANDLSFWLAAFGSSAQSISCAASCP
jgi:hypothetical protein